MRNIILLIILTAFVGMFIGCNSTGEPINPPQKPGQDTQQTLPSPPNVGTPVPGENDPLRVVVSKSADSGKIPFKVDLLTTVTGGIEPYKYSWDFDSNGVTDAVDPNPNALYASPGIFYIKLTVEDDGGTQTTETLEVEALEPTPNPVAEALPETGSAPLDVNFVAEDSSSQVGASIVEYRWDFDADGIWDYTDIDTGNTFWTYEDPGNYYPVLRIYDNLGYWEEMSLHIIVDF